MAKIKSPVKSQRRPESPKRVMGSSEREALLDQIEQEKAFQDGLGQALPESGALGPLGEANDLSVSKAKISQRIGNMSRAVASGEALQLRGAARNAAIARYKHLEGALPELLMTLRDQDLFPRDGHDYHQAVRRATKEIGSSAVQKDIQEFLKLGRSLFADEPERSSIERLRKKH